MGAATDTFKMKHNEYRADSLEERLSAIDQNNEEEMQKVISLLERTSADLKAWISLTQAELEDAIMELANVEKTLKKFKRKIKDN